MTVQFCLPVLNARNTVYSRLPDALGCLTEIKSATAAKCHNGLIPSPRRNNILRLFCFTWNITVRFNFRVLDGTTIPTTIGFRTLWAALRKTNQLPLPSIATDWSHPLDAITAFDFSVSHETLRYDSISMCSMHDNTNYDWLPDALSCLTEIISATVAKYRNELIRYSRSKYSLRLFCFTWNTTVRFDFQVLGDTTIPTTIATIRIELPYGNQISYCCHVSQRIDLIPSKK